MRFTWLALLALGLLAGCGDDGGDPDGGLDAGPPTDAGPSDAGTPVIDGGPGDAGPPASDGGSPDAEPPGVCSGEIVECHPEPSVEYRCGGDSCPEACGDLAACSACAPHAMSPAIQSYFDALALPLVEFDGSLLHCGAAQCSLAADFNGDGTEDWAGMFRYTGPRGGDRDLDLLIIYSDGGSYRHFQQPMFGRVVGGVGLVYLVLQNAGPVTGYAVSLTLDHPSIRAYRVDLLGESSAPGCYSESLVFHWDGATFARQSLSFFP